MKLTFRKFLVLWFSLIVPSMSLAQSSTTPGGILKERREEQRQQELKRTIDQKKTPQEDEVLPEITDKKGGREILVKTIRVEDHVILTDEEIENVVSKYEHKSLTIEQIRELTAEITSLYRSKGYVTSRAYLPPQTIDDGVLIIKVVEGKFGDVSIKGNKYFSSKLLRQKIPFTPGEYFDYPQFVKHLEFMNEHPDRLVKANLVPGKEPGETDVVLEVTERRPFHVEFDFDNWADKNLGRYRYTLTLLHNNLLGFDDRLSLSALSSDTADLMLQQGRYLFPLNSRLSVGGYFIYTQTEPARDFKDLNIKGRGSLYGLFATNEFIRTPELNMRANVGFDFIHAKNKVLGDVVSNDELRVLRLGNEWDFVDPLGRNIFNFEGDFGFPDFLGSMEDKDPDASRVGSGGKFQKWLLDYYRLQPLPWEMNVLWKNNSQITNHNLTTVEQFQLGGPTSVRGYDLGQFSGDKGYYTALELSVPVYGLSKQVRFPFHQGKLYDALRLVAFYDYGFTSSKNADVAGAKRNHNLRSIGWGIRVNPSNDMAMRVEVGYPLGNKTTDLVHETHVWFDMQFQF